MALETPATPAEHKRISTARARAALRGIVLHELLSDSGSPEFIGTHGAWTHSFRTVEEVENWLNGTDGEQA